MACAFARLGSRVTLIDVAARVLPGADPEASEVLGEALAEQGIALRLGTRITGYDPAGGLLALDGPEGAGAVAGVDAVLVAVGRTPNVAGFEDAVATGPGGIVVDGWGRTSAEGVWAVGDVTPVAHQTHAANAHGRRIVQRIALPWIPPLGRPPVVPDAVFSDPEVAWVGPDTARSSPGAATPARWCGCGSTSPTPTAASPTASATASSRSPRCG